MHTRQQRECEKSAPTVTRSGECGRCVSSGRRPSAPAIGTARWSRGGTSTCPIPSDRQTSRGTWPCRCSRGTRVRARRTCMCTTRTAQAAVRMHMHIYTHARALHSSQESVARTHACTHALHCGERVLITTVCEPWCGVVLPQLLTARLVARGEGERRRRAGKREARGHARRPEGACGGGGGSWGWGGGGAGAVEERAIGLRRP